LVVADFVLKNVTSQPIKVLGIKGGCACTVTEGLPVNLAAGESGKIQLSLRVGRFESSNTITRSAEVFTNRDGMVPPLVIQVHEGDSPKT
jgi:hypothetical protein